MIQVLKCKLLTIYYTIRYARSGLLSGYVLSGHDFKGDGGVCDDHWTIVCSRCGIKGGSEVLPPESVVHVV